MRADDATVRERLVEYAARRQSAASSREKLALRFAEQRGIVVEHVTESRAQKVRQEVEAFGAFADVERDADAVVRPMKAPVGGKLMAIVVVAFGVLGIGVYQLVGETPRPADPAPDDTRSRSSGKRATAADPAVDPVAPKAPAPAAGAPEDALAGVALAGTNTKRPAFFVDPEGWMVGLNEGEKELDVTVDGQPVRALLVRRALGTRLGLYRMRAPAPFALSLGDASTLGAGDRVHLADPNAGKLVTTNVVQPDHRVGRFVYFRFEAPAPGVELDGAPLFDGRGLLVGVYDHSASTIAAMPLALPVNRLTDGVGAVLTLVQPARRPAAKMTAWLEAADAADRAQRPAVYKAIEGTLLMTIICPGSSCTGQVGALTLDGNPPRARSLDAFFFDRGQKATAVPQFGRTGDVDLTVDWQSAPLGESLLLGALPTPIRKSILRGDVAGLQLYVASYRVGRPPSAQGAPVRVLLSGADGRRSPARLIGEESSQVRGPSDDVQDR